MNQIVNKFLLAGDKFMPEMHLKQPGFTYSACGPFTKTQQRIKKYRETGDTSHLYKNALDQACFRHDLAYGKKDLASRTIADRELRDDAFKVAQDATKDGYQRGLAAMVYKFFDKKISGSGLDRPFFKSPAFKSFDKNFQDYLIKQELKIEAEKEKWPQMPPILTSRQKKAAKLKVAKNMAETKTDLTGKELAEELHKRVIKKFPRRSVEVNEIDDIWAADLADMKNLKHAGPGKFLLCVIDLYSKYAWVVPLRSKAGEEVERGFSEIFKERRPKKIWVDRGTEFYNQKVKKRLGSIELYSTFNEGKSVVAERFIRTLKERLYKKMTETRDKNYLKYLDAIVFDYNNTIHSTTGMKPIDVKPGSLGGLYGSKKPTGTPKFEPGDIVRITEKKNIFKKGYTPNWTRQLFKVKERLETKPWTYRLRSSDGSDVYGTFYEQELQKSKSQI